VPTGVDLLSRGEEPDFRAALPGRGKIHEPGCAPRSAATPCIHDWEAGCSSRMTPAMFPPKLAAGNDS
jgi:hypothetical protein